MKKSKAPETAGRYVLIKVGKKYASNTLIYAIERALEGEPLNAEQRVALISVLVQLREHRSARYAKKKQA